VGCSGYPECNFSLPLPQKGSIYVTSKNCEEHGVRILKIRGKNSWNFCPICNYDEFLRNNKRGDKIALDS
ncbi:MAG: hypothetical protein NZ879_08535, partial [Archaeoglobaceae archaeon]|nr:hypothetical protein [Archaeoglobaceae archaeon]MDW8119010.1 hypothetical protein [Archaeoglobaceae archaeon]